MTNHVDINWMNTRLSPVTWDTHDQSIRITNPKAKRIPKGYIYSTESGDSQFKA